MPHNFWELSDEPEDKEENFWDAVLKEEENQEPVKKRDPNFLDDPGVKGLLDLIGQEGTLIGKPNEPFCPRVKVIDIRRSYGRVQLCVEPVKGEGEKWVNKSSVLFDSQHPNEEEEMPNDENYPY